MAKLTRKIRPGNVLLIDDEPYILEMLSSELKDREISHLCASDGKAALNAIEKDEPLAIVSDFKMPGLNGMELLKFLKNLGKEMPVIWLTGNADSDTITDAWRLGVFHVFEKPIDPAIVADEVVKALESSPTDRLSGQPPYITDKLLEKYFQKIEIQIKKPLYEKLKKQCLTRSVSVNSFIIELLENHLK